MAHYSHIPQNIRRIRNGCGLTQEQAANEAGISRQAFRSIESGQAEPRVSNLQGIARALGVDLPALLAEPPRLASVRFRSAKAKTTKAQATRDQVIVDVARWLKDFNFLEESLGEHNPYALGNMTAKLASVEESDRPIEAARQARAVLGLTAEEPIRDVCGLLESAGVKVQALVLEIEDVFGLSVSSGDGGPAIIVNVREDISVERRIFTAAHELGHLLLHPHAYDVQEARESRDEEGEADLFASHFLLPEGLFEKEWRDTSGLPFMDRVLHTKRIFHVSYKTVLYRLGERGADPKIWPIFKAMYKQRYRASLTKRIEPEPLVELDFVEDRLSRLVRKALEAAKITLSRGAEILGVDLNTMRDRVASWEVAA